MEKEKVTKVKKFPIFWTYLKRDGKTTIHQVRFKSLLTFASTNDYPSGQQTEVVFSILEIANTIGQWIGGESSFGDSNYHDLSLIFATKEDAIKASQGNEIKGEFRAVCPKDGWYKIGKNSVLYGSEWLWYNHIPQNMVLSKRSEGCELYLGGYTWTGVKTIKTAVRHDYSDGVNIFGIRFRRIGTYAAFDMVSGQYIGEPTKEFYKTREECDAKHQIQVFEFED